MVEVDDSFLAYADAMDEPGCMRKLTCRLAALYSLLKVHHAPLAVVAVSCGTSLAPGTSLAAWHLAFGI